VSDDEAAVLVVLRPARGDLGDVGPITARNLESAAPDPEAAERARATFADLGLTPGPVVGISFALHGPRERLRELLPDLDAKEGTGQELDLFRLPAAAREAIQAVVSEAPPEFGPWNP
jgi:hypothetical protein